MPTRRLPRTAPPSVRNTKPAPRTKPVGVDQARLSSQTSSVLRGSGMSARLVFHQAPIFLESNGSTSSARPILPPGRSG